MSVNRHLDTLGIALEHLQEGFAAGEQLAADLALIQQGHPLDAGAQLDDALARYREAVKAAKRRHQRRGRAIETRYAKGAGPNQ